MDNSLHILIDAPPKPGRTGGVASAVLSLIRAVGQLDGPERYTIVASRSELEYVEPLLGPNQKVALRPDSLYAGRPPLLARALRPFRPAVRYTRRLLNSRVWPEVPISQGFYESLEADVLHIPTQNFVLCALPTVYNPHDLQHLHYPQFWEPSTLAWRETIYPAGCHFAHTVVVNSQWVKEDVMRHYRTRPEKIQVIPEAPPTQSQPDPSADSIRSVKVKHLLEQPFALYPAVCWPHKNHLRLLEALAFLRDTRGRRIRLVCTGSLHPDFWPHIASRITELRLQDQVRFLGFVPDEDLRAIYRLADVLVLPTLFEANSLPIFEAWLDGLPVACSHVTSLPEQVQDAALLFDPTSVASIAEALEKLAKSDELRQDLRARGSQRVKDFDWERTAKAYRAVYRRAARRPLTEEDRWLLEWDWMRHPEPTRESRSR